MARSIHVRLYRGNAPRLSFFRDRTGHEVDALLDTGAGILPIEIKSGKTIASDYCAGLTYFHKLTKGKHRKPLLIYGGETEEQYKNVRFFGWKAMKDIHKILQN